MDFYAVFTKWYPGPQDIINRPVEGLYLLQNLPDMAEFPLKEYEKDSLDTMRKVITSVSGDLNKVEDSGKHGWKSMVLVLQIVNI